MNFPSIDIKEILRSTEILVYNKQKDLIESIACALTKKEENTVHRIQSIGLAIRVANVAINAATFKKEDPEEYEEFYWDVWSR